MSNEHVNLRQRLARQIGVAYAEQPGVAAVMLAGSTARGTADGFSDIEIDVFWDVAPTDDELLQPIERLGGELLYREADANEWADGFYIEGIKVDTSQFLVGTMERWLDEVVGQADPDVEKQLLIAAVQHAQTLSGEGLIATWRERAAAYPDALARAMVEQEIVFRPRYLLTMLAERDDTLLFYHNLVGAARKIMAVLMGLNRLYIAHPDFKWLDWQTAQMRIAPPDLPGRLRRMLRAEPRAAAEQAHTLIAELFDLVDRHLPAASTARAREVFDERRSG